MIKVTVHKPSSRRYYLAQWVDEITGNIKTRSTRETVKRDAERFAARLEDELNAGESVDNTTITWERFKERYTAEVSATKRPKTGAKTKSTFNAIDREIGPRLLAALANPNVISKFSADIRDGRSPSTVDGHLREFRKILRWAKKMGLIRKMPHIEFPDFDEEMKGRPITGEEFERMLSKVPDHVEPQFLEEWLFFLHGLWLSGFRLNESMLFHWTDDRCLAPDFSRKRPMYRIQAKTDKGKVFRLLPMPPELAELLQAVPMDRRNGFVFNPFTFKPGAHYKEGSKTERTPHRPTANHVGRIISDIGKTAGVKVNDKKYASAHDFRRSFGVRWCKIVFPKVLMEMMRHESMETTMTFYVGQMADDAAEEMYQAVALRKTNTLTNSNQNSPSTPTSETQSNPIKQDI